MLFPYSLPCGLPCSPLKKASTNYLQDTLPVNSQVIDQCMMTVQDRTVTDGFHRVIAERSLTIWLSICARAVSCHSHFILSLCYHTGLLIRCLRYSFRSPYGPVSILFLRIVSVDRHVTHGARAESSPGITPVYLPAISS